MNIICAVLEPFGSLDWLVHRLVQLPLYFYVQNSPLTAIACFSVYWRKNADSMDSGSNGLHKIGRSLRPGHLQVLAGAIGQGLSPKKKL